MLILSLLLTQFFLGFLSAPIIDLPRAFARRLGQEPAFAPPGLAVLSSWLWVPAVALVLSGLPVARAVPLLGAALLVAFAGLAAFALSVRSAR